jgi:hypothetical protein
MNEESKRHKTSKTAVAAGLFAAVLVLAGCVASSSGNGVAARAPESTSASCGNGRIEVGESCDSCPADCRVPSCPGSGEKVTFDVRLAVPFGDDATSVTTLISYDGGLTRFPGSGLTPEAQKGIQNRPKGASTYANAFGSAVRVVQTKNDGLPSGAIYSVVLDRCKDAREATAADLTCAVEGCAGKFGLIDGCSCSIVQSQGSLDVSIVGTKQD